MSQKLPMATAGADADLRSAALTIITVNWNGGEKLIRCLRTIRMSQTSFPVKVIVVDNDSRDGSQELAAAEFPEFQVINTGANLGFGRGNNFARPWVDTPLVLFLNPDTELFSDTLEQAVRSLLSRPEVGMLGCQMRAPDGSIQLLNLQWFPTPMRIFCELLFPNAGKHQYLKRFVPVHNPLRSGQVSILCGAFLLARKAALDEAGWFDERYFMYAEEVDLCRAMQEHGWRLYYEARCAFIHHDGGLSSQADKSYPILMQLCSRYQLIEKYYGVRRALRYRRLVALAAFLRISVLALIRLLPHNCRDPLVCWENAWLRSRLIWDWAVHHREAAVPGATGNVSNRATTLNRSMPRPV